MNYVLKKKNKSINNGKKVELVIAIQSKGIRLGGKMGEHTRKMQPWAKI